MENKIISTTELFSNVESVLESGQNVKLVVHGYSMQPTFRNLKDYVILEPKGKKLQVGDIVLYNVGNEGMMFLHRIARISGDGKLLYIRGDGNYSPFEHIKAEKVKAIVIAGTMFSGHKFKANSFGFRLYSRLYLWSYPLRRIIIAIYVKLHRTTKK